MRCVVAEIMEGLLVFLTRFEKSKWFRLNKSFVLKEFKLNKDDVVLDLGGGTGEWTRDFSRFVKQVVLIDLEEPKGGYEGCLHIAQKSLRKKTNIHVIKGDICHLPIKPASFNKALCWHVLEHIDGIEIVFKEMGKVMKKDGILLIETWCTTLVDGYSFPVSRFLRKIIPSKARMRSPHFLCGPYLKYTFDEIKKALGHVCNGYSLLELKSLGTINNLKISKCIYRQRGIGPFLMELTNSIPILKFLLMPIRFLYYKRELRENPQMCQKAGWIITVKYVKNL